VKDAVSKRKLAKFAAGGLDEEDLMLIGSMYKKYDSPVNGIKVPDTSKWVLDDGTIHPIVDRLARILKKESDMAIVTPGSGDLPLVMRTPVGSMIGQFKSFSFSAINRIMIPGMQRMAIGDVDAVAGMMTQFGLGAAVYGLKMVGMGREDDIDTSWENIVSEMTMRSGYFGILADANAISHKLSRGKLSVQSALGGGDISRYYSRSVVGDMIGPTFGTMTDTTRAIGALFSGEFNRGDLSSVRRLMPYQNLYWTRRFLSEAENSVADNYGL